jgi:alpha-tubulin suppressor-like RCC1 family protein
VLCWGTNSLGGLGNGSTTDNRMLPVHVTGLASGVSVLSTGDESSCAVASNGALVCWGAMANSLAPIPIAGLTSGVTGVSVSNLGSRSACAITAAADVVCWGDIAGGGSGVDPTTHAAAPVQVADLSHVTAISVADYTACAIIAGGGVVCWGANDKGALGDNSTTESIVPVQVQGLTSGVTAVSVGEASACAITAGGGVKCWGFGAFGQLGNGSREDSMVPVQVTGLTNGIRDVSVGSGAACAVTNDGRVMCWGAGGEGLLGNNSTESSAIPVPVVGFP